MVYMKDSERAAQQIGIHRKHTGLHINLSEEFTAINVPEDLENAHRRIRKFLNFNKYALILFNPLLIRDFKKVFRCQLEEFRRLYQKEPSHMDGHQHMHLSSNMILQKILPEGIKIRRSFSFSSGQKSIVNRTYRSWIDRAISKRHQTADYFFTLPVHQSIEHFVRYAKLAKQKNVELMTHPEWEEDFNYLTSFAYKKALSNTKLSSYADL